MACGIHRHQVQAGDQDDVPVSDADAPGGCFICKAISDYLIIITSLIMAEAAYHLFQAENT